MAPEPLDETLLARYLSGEASPEECERVRDWVGDDIGRRAQVAAVGQAWDRVGTVADAEVPVPDMAAAWQRLAARAEAPRRVAIDHARAGHAVRARRSVIATVALGLSLVFVAVLVGHGVLGTSGLPHTYASSAGQQLSVRLADGTVVQLAPESRLEVPAGYRHGARTVALEGEGYFAVVHNALHPFAVRVRDAEVTDIGTQFNVRAYAEDAAVRVAVAEGSVVLERGAGRRVGDPPLRIGDMADIMANRIVITHNADIATATAWIQGRLVFNDTPLRDVARELARTFDLTVTIPDSTLGRELVTGNFGNQPVNVILDDITAVIGARYERHGKQVVIRPAATTTGPATPSSRPIVHTALARDSHE